MLTRALSLAGWGLSGSDPSPPLPGSALSSRPPRQRQERTVYSKEQQQELEKRFQMNQYPTYVEREALAARLNLREQQVQVRPSSQTPSPTPALSSQDRLGRRTYRMRGPGPPPVLCPGSHSQQRDPKCTQPLDLESTATLCCTNGPTRSRPDPRSTGCPSPRPQSLYEPREPLGQTLSWSPGSWVPSPAPLALCICVLWASWRCMFWGVQAEV